LRSHGVDPGVASVIAAESENGFWRAVSGPSLWVRVSGAGDPSLRPSAPAVPGMAMAALLQSQELESR
jgi:hypothetical protein